MPPFYPIIHGPGIKVFFYLYSNFFYFPNHFVS